MANAHVLAAAAAVSLLLLCSVPAATPAPLAGAYGVDISQNRTDADFQCLSKYHSVQYAIIRAYRSLGIVDYSAPYSAAAAHRAGIEVDVYHFPDTSQDPTTQVQTCLTFLKSNNVQFGRYWLDIERFAWSGDTAANTKFIQAMADAVTGAGVSLGIYSGRYSWPAITGDSTAFSQYPLWYAHYEVPPNPSFSDYRREGPYGGWTNPYMKQYSGSGSVCGMTVDLDWRPSL